MSYNVVVMFVVAALLMGGGVMLLLRIGKATTTERQVYAYRMIGIMLVSAGVVLAMSAGAMWSWSKGT